MSGYCSSSLSICRDYLCTRRLTSGWIVRRAKHCLRGISLRVASTKMTCNTLSVFVAQCRSNNNQCHCVQCHSKLVARPSQSSFTLRCSNSRENLYLPSRSNGPRGLPRGRSYSGHHVSHPQSDQCILLSRERSVSRRSMIERNSLAPQLGKVTWFDAYPLPK